MSVLLASDSFSIRALGQRGMTLQGRFLGGEGRELCSCTVIRSLRRRIDNPEPKFGT